MSYSEKEIEHFMKRVKKTNTCWIWTGIVKRDGYGTFIVYDHAPKNAHRVSYEIFKGEITKGLQIHHKCGFRACVNPEHLEMMTQKENIQKNSGKFRRNPWTEIKSKESLLGIRQ